MTSKRVLVDTGPLVAVFSRRDQFHDICMEQMRRLSAPLLTCWPVITETAWLLKENPLAVQRLLGEFGVGFLKLLSIEDEAMPWIIQFIRRYSDLGVQLADACLIYLAERESIDTIFTLDRRDFSVFRIDGNLYFHLLPEL
ncbi:MAG: PIN domain-containing protein [Candidatus Omnitrophota bacterium]